MNTKPFLTLGCVAVVSITSLIGMHEDNTSETCAENACALPSGDGLANKISQEVASSRTEDEWREILTPEQFRVLRQHGTERPFRNEFWDNKAKGHYTCAGCGVKLFTSNHKYKSGTGWPSFYDTMESKNVGTTVDKSHGMVRTEVHCSNCGGHLGHLFPDGPKPTGQRYCINSASLQFTKKAKK